MDEAPVAETPMEEPAQTEIPKASEPEAVEPPTGGQAVAGLAAPLMRYAVQLSDGSPFAGQIVDLVLDLEGAPVMDLGIWPDPLDPRWVAALQSYWGTAGMSSEGA